MIVRPFSMKLIFDIVKGLRNGPGCSKLKFVERQNNKQMKTHFNKYGYTCDCLSPASRRGSFSNTCSGLRTGFGSKLKLVERQSNKQMKTRFNNYSYTCDCPSPAMAGEVAFRHCVGAYEIELALNSSSSNVKVTNKGKPASTNMGVHAIVPRRLPAR